MLPFSLEFSLDKPQHIRVHLKKAIKYLERIVTTLQCKHIDLITIVLTFDNWMHMPMGMESSKVSLSSTGKVYASREFK